MESTKVAYMQWCGGLVWIYGSGSGLVFQQQENVEICIYKVVYL